MKGERRGALALCGLSPYPALEPWKIQPALPHNPLTPYVNLPLYREMSEFLFLANLPVSF